MIQRAVAVAAVGLVLAAGQSVPHAAAAPDHRWMSFAGGIAPGGSIAQVSDDRKRLARCTVGFIAAKGADRFVVTAGHCNKGAGWSTSVVYTDAAAPTVARVAGRFDASRTEDGKQGGAGFPMPTDMGVIRVDPSARVATPLIAGRYKVSEILRQEQLREGMQICKFGSRTEETCGPIRHVGNDYVQAAVAGAEGDSGALGFVKKKDGSVAAVGILHGSGATFYYLTPPLRSMGLSLVANP